MTVTGSEGQRQSETPWTGNAPALKEEIFLYWDEPRDTIRAGE